jgi:hypothetical protein
LQWNLARELPEVEPSDESLGAGDGALTALGGACARAPVKSGTGGTGDGLEPRPPELPRPLPRPRPLAALSEEMTDSVADDRKPLMRVLLVARNHWIEAVQDDAGVEEAHVRGRDLAGAIIAPLVVAVLILTV